MKLIDISNKEAEDILVNGEDKSFSTFEYQGTMFTIYHRKINEKVYDLVEFTVKEYTYYKLLDHDEVIQLLGGIKV